MARGDIKFYCYLQPFVDLIRELKTTKDLDNCWMPDVPAFKYKTEHFDAAKKFFHPTSLGTNTALLDNVVRSVGHDHCIISLSLRLLVGLLFITWCFNLTNLNVIKTIK